MVCVILLDLFIIIINYKINILKKKGLIKVEEILKILATGMKFLSTEEIDGKTGDDIYQDPLLEDDETKLRKEIE